MVVALLLALPSSCEALTLGQQPSIGQPPTTGAPGQLAAAAADSAISGASGASGALRNGARALFVAGLEGSGHHFLEALWAKFRSTQGFNVEDMPIPGQWGCAMTWEKTEGYQVMLNIFQLLPAGSVNIMPALYSYPCGLASHTDRRDHFFPHVNWISEAALETDTDFRVIYLYRPLEELLKADCLHREMEASCTLEAETLVSNAEHLIAQLGVVRRNHHSVQCLVYGDLPQTIGSLEQALGIDLELGSVIKDLWQPAETEDEDITATYDWWPELVRSVQGADAKLAEACNGAPLISSMNLLDTFRYAGPLL